MLNIHPLALAYLTAFRGTRVRHDAQIDRLTAAERAWVHAGGPIEADPDFQWAPPEPRDDDTYYRLDRSGDIQGCDDIPATDDDTDPAPTGDSAGDTTD